MEKKVVLVDADEKHSSSLCRLMEENGYGVVPLHATELLEESLQDTDCLAVIIDIDTIQVDNRYVRDLTIGHPGVCVLGLSGEAMHPELREAICYHIYACIRKPVDPAELLYWLKSIEEDIE